MPQESESSGPVASTTPGVYCKGCGYALVGLESSRCPECGRRFDRGNWRTFDCQPSRFWVRRWGWRLAGMMLGLMALKGLTMGWFWYGWQNEQQAIGELRSLDASISLKPLGPKWWHEIFGDSFRGHALRVERLSLVRRRAAEIEAVHLKSLEHLESLTLFACELDDNVVKEVSGLTTLRGLGLHSSTSNNLDLAPLTKLPRLNTLHLSGRSFDDAGIEPLKKSISLRVLLISGTRVTPSGIESLKKANPGLVVRDLPIGQSMPAPIP